MNNLLNDWNFTSCPSSFCRRKFIENVGLLDRYGNDLDYTFRITKEFNIYYIGSLL